MKGELLYLRVFLYTGTVLLNMTLTIKDVVKKVYWAKPAITLNSLKNIMNHIMRKGAH